MWCGKRWRLSNHLELRCELHQVTLGCARWAGQSPSSLLSVRTSGLLKREVAWALSPREPGFCWSGCQAPLPARWLRPMEAVSDKTLCSPQAKRILIDLFAYRETLGAVPFNPQLTKLDGLFPCPCWIYLTELVGVYRLPDTGRTTVQFLLIGPAPQSRYWYRPAYGWSPRTAWYLPPTAKLDWRQQHQ